MIIHNCENCQKYSKGGCNLRQTIGTEWECDFVSNTDKTNYSKHKGTFIEEVINLIQEKHCYHCDCLDEGDCCGCDVYNIIEEIGDAFTEKKEAQGDNK